MKASIWLGVPFVLAALVLQGCATGGDVNYAPGAKPAATSSSSNAKIPVVQAVSDKSSLDAVRAAVTQQMQVGGRFDSVDRAGREKIDTRFQDMTSLFDQFGTMDKMNGAARERINDDQNAINEVLAMHDGNRLICHDETPVGSHLPKRVCRTLSQIRADKQNANQLMQRMQNNGSNNIMNGGH